MAITNLGTKISRLGTATVAPLAPANQPDATTVNGEKIDLLDYEGDIVFQIVSTATGNAQKTCTFSLLESSTETDGDFGAISAAGGGPLTVTHDNAGINVVFQRNCDHLKRYVRLRLVTVGSSLTGHYAATGFGSKKYGA